jgi:hypothetical protein
MNFAPCLTPNRCKMRTLLILAFTGLFTHSNAQELSGLTFERKGFIIGAALGASSINLNFPSRSTFHTLSASFPNIKMGAMISKRTALLVYLPGSIYTYTGSGRKRDRGFEGIIPSIQYWLKDRWWVLGGAGIGLDAPAFYDVKNEEEKNFNFGSSLTIGTGYEIWRKGKFAMDIQSRVHYGSATVSDGVRTGLAFNILLGFNWY